MTDAIRTQDYRHTGGIRSWQEADGGYDAFGGVTAADYDGDGRPDIIGKSYRANWVNGVDGKNHVDVCWNQTAE